MKTEEIPRKNLDNDTFLQLRQATEKIAGILDKRLKHHLTVLKPLFMPRKLFGTYIKSASKDEVAGSDKAFAELQEEYEALCEKPFGLPRKLQSPLPPIQNQLEGTPYQYTISCGGSQQKTTSIISSTRWVLSYRSECPLNRLRAMLDGRESPQPDDMRQSLIDHLALIVFLKHFPALTQLLEDLRYQVEIEKLGECGDLPVVVLKAPLETFLPPDDFIIQVTQLSGIAAFQEIIDLEALKDIPDPLKETLNKSLT